MFASFFVAKWHSGGQKPPAICILKNVRDLTKHLSISDLQPKMNEFSPVPSPAKYNKDLHFYIDCMKGEICLIPLESVRRKSINIYPKLVKDIEWCEKGIKIQQYSLQTTLSLWLKKPSHYANIGGFLLTWTDETSVFEFNANFFLWHRVW